MKNSLVICEIVGPHLQMKSFTGIAVYSFWTSLLSVGKEYVHYQNGKQIGRFRITKLKLS